MSDSRNIPANHFDVTDNRRFGFFIVDNDLFDSGVARKIGPTAFVVYAYLLRRAGQARETYPKIKTIAEHTGVSSRSVTSALRVLVEHGLLDATRRQRGYLYEITDLTRQANSAGQNSRQANSAGQIGKICGSLPTRRKLKEEDAQPPLPLEDQRTKGDTEDEKQPEKYRGVVLNLPRHVSADTAREFIDHRVKLKKPLTQGAFERAMKTAASVTSSTLLTGRGYTADKVIQKTIDFGWQGVNIEWIENAVNRIDGRRDGGNGAEPVRPQRPLK